MYVVAREDRVKSAQQLVFLKTSGPKLLRKAEIPSHGLDAFKSSIIRRMPLVSLKARNALFERHKPSELVSCATETNTS